MFAYILTLYFTCGSGCGVPPYVTINAPCLKADGSGYQNCLSLQACQAAGALWMAPASNPALPAGLTNMNGKPVKGNTLLTTRCNKVKIQ